MHAAKRGVVKQRRWGSDGFAYAKRGTVPVNENGWSRVRDFEMEKRVSRTTARDERVEGLFGADNTPWVQPVKEVSLSCTVDPERRTLWEQALYSQIPDLRNDMTHRNAQGVPQKVANGDEPLRRFGGGDMEAGKFYYGMYPNEFEQNPGEYWKQRCGTSLYSHMVWEREKAKEMARFGGKFGLPTDDYQTTNGVLPFLSAEAFRELKYKVHEPLVRRLNATANQDQDLQEIIDTTIDEGVRSDAVQHLARTVMLRSIRPRGGVLRKEFEVVLDQKLGGRAALDSSIIHSALIYSGDSTVWILYNKTTDGLEVVAMKQHEALPQHTIPLGALVIDSQVWSMSYDSAKEYAERFVQALDYDYLYSAYCHATGLPTPEPLVF